MKTWISKKLIFTNYHIKSSNFILFSTCTLSNLGANFIKFGGAKFRIWWGLAPKAPLLASPLVHCIINFGMNLGKISEI